MSIKRVGYIDGRRTYFYDDTVIAVSKDGNDDRGNGSPTAPYLTITKAFTKVTATRKAILLSPGVYQENLTWPSINRVHLIGLEKPSNENYGCIVKTESEEVGGGPAITVNPSVQAATFEMTIQNILLDHADAKGMTIDNENVGRKFNCYLSHVVGEGDGRFIEVVHTDADECIRVYMDGDSYEIEGPIYFTVKNSDDRLYCSNVWLSGGIETSADAVAIHIRLKDCLIKQGTGGAGQASVVGGNGAQLITMLNCYDEAAQVYTPAATVQGSHTVTKYVTA